MTTKTTFTTTISDERTGPMPNAQDLKALLDSVRPRSVQVAIRLAEARAGIEAAEAADVIAAQSRLSAQRLGAIAKAAEATSAAIEELPGKLPAPTQPGEDALTPLESYLAAGAVRGSKLDLEEESHLLRAARELKFSGETLEQLLAWAAASDRHRKLATVLAKLPGLDGQIIASTHVEHVLDALEAALAFLKAMREPPEPQQPPTAS
jgi:hypothetical protein